MLPNKIGEMKEGTEVLVSYGLWDLIVCIEAETLGHIDQTIIENRKIREFEQTSTLIGSLKL